MATLNFRQRKFPWIQGLAEPAKVDMRAVARCTGRGMAARAALQAKPGGPWTDAWLATRLGVSRGYLSRILTDKQEMPDWMVRPICYATGTWLVQQYAELFDEPCEVTAVANLIRPSIELRAA